MDIGSTFTKVFGNAFPTAAQIRETLRQVGGDTELALAQLVTTGQELLTERTAFCVATENATLSAQLASVPFSKRPAIINEHETAWRDTALVLQTQDPLAATVTTAEDSYLYYQGQSDAGNGPLFTLLHWRTRRELQPAVAAVILAMAAGVHELHQAAAQDLAVFSQVRTHLVTKRNNLSAGQRSVLDPAGDWIRDPEFLQQFAGNIVKDLLAQPVGALGAKDPSTVVVAMCEDLVHIVEPPAGLVELPPHTVAQSLNALDPWAGVHGPSRLLWDIPAPVAFIEAPAGLVLPPNVPAGCTVERVDNDDPHTLLLRLFKWAPLPAVEGFDEWLDGDMDLRIRNNGQVTTSGEADPDAVHNPLLLRFDQVRDRWSTPVVAGPTTRGTATNGHAAMVANSHASGTSTAANGHDPDTSKDGDVLVIPVHAEV